MSRVCFDCGAHSAEVQFPGPRKPSRTRDRCCACADGLAGAELSQPRRPTLTLSTIRAARRSAQLSEGRPAP
jgi:hypothetical protein